METILKQYRVWPGVVPVGETTRVTVAPADYGRWEEGEYDLFVYPLFDLRQIPADQPDATVRTVRGCLQLDHVFPAEGEYFLRVHPKGCPEKQKRLAQVSVYAVERDLYDLHPMKMDFHVHSSRSDGKEAPGVVAARYRKAGYDGFALTDHNRYFPSGEVANLFGDAGTDMLFLRGEEVHVPADVLRGVNAYGPGCAVHIVAVGGRESVAEKYVKDPQAYREQVAALSAEFDPADPFRGEKAHALWATRQIHAAGGFAVFCHPYWVTGSDPGVNNVPQALCRFFLHCGWFDAFELMGGQVGPHGGHHGNDLAEAQFRQAREEGVRLTVVGNSDSHSTLTSQQFDTYYTIAFPAARTREGILDAVRTGHCVAVNTFTPETGLHLFGDFRLVAYARYLLQSYFPARIELLAGQGLAMEEYLQGGCPAEELACSGLAAQRFRERFFGRAPAPLPSDQVLAAAADGKTAWEDYGVVSRGSAVLFRQS